MKYKLTDSIIEYKGKRLYQIESLKGERGGYIEKESNLSQYGHCWIQTNTLVFGDVKISNTSSDNEGFSLIIVRGVPKVKSFRRIKLYSAYLFSFVIYIILSVLVFKVLSDVMSYFDLDIIIKVILTLLAMYIFSKYRFSKE